MDTPTTTAPVPKPRARKQRDISRPLDALTPSQAQVLVCLARYRYMTARQLVACGVASRVATVRQEVLPRLCRLAGDNLVQVQKELPFAVGNGRFSYVYALTARGAEVVADMPRAEPGPVRYPIGGIQYANDFQHREAYVDFCIALDAWIAAGEARHCRILTHYFDKTGANRRGQPSRSVNRLELPKAPGVIVPDGLALIDTETKRRALVIEIHHKTDTKRIAEQLIAHMHALAAGVVERHLGHDKSPFVLSVATTREAAALVKKRMATVSGIERFAPVFLFNDLQTIMRDGFAAGWTHYDGRPAGVFG